MWSKRWRCGGCSGSTQRQRVFLIEKSHDLAEELHTVLLEHHAVGTFADLDQPRQHGWSGGDMPRCRQPGKRVGEFIAVQRLDQKTIHAGLETGIAVLDQGV